MEQAPGPSLAFGICLGPGSGRLRIGIEIRLGPCPGSFWDWIGIGTAFGQGPILNILGPCVCIIMCTFWGQQRSHLYAGHPFHQSDIGAKVADKKCFSFAADSKTREFLSMYVWDSNGLKIPTVNNFRDIGAHINLASNCNGKTLTERMQKAIGMAKRLMWMPLPIEFKEKYSSKHFACWLICC